MKFEKETGTKCAVIEINAYTTFLDTLRRLTFKPVNTILTRREDLISFYPKNDPRRGLVSAPEPDFGEHIAKWGGMEPLKQSARPNFSYYCGFCGDIHFNSRSRYDKSVYFLPMREHTNYLPRIGEVFMGHVEMGEKSRRFVWWDVAGVQDQRFKQMMVDGLTFSADKLEAKLIFTHNNGRIDRKLFWIIKALHPSFRDIDFFVALTKKYQGINYWLQKYISPILPEFWDEFRQKTAAIKD